jgi:hypothetical protein
MKVMSIQLYKKIKKKINLVDGSGGQYHERMYLKNITVSGGLGPD